MATNTLVTVQKLPPAEAGAVLNRRSVVVGNVLVMATMLVFWASLAGGVAGLNLVGAVGRTVWPPLSRLPAGDRGVVGVGLVVTCGALAAVSGYVGLKTPGVPGNLFYRRLARRQVARRRVGKVVDPDRPGAVPVRFVQVVPRQNWGRLMLETATDTGFLQVDPGRREVRFEGDVERFVVPADAITGCGVEHYAATAGNSSITYSVCVLRGRTADGEWEAPVSLRGTDWFAPPDHRARTAAELADEIAALLPSDRTGNDDDGAAAAANLAYRSPAKSWRQRAGSAAVLVLAVGFGLWRGWSRRHGTPTHRAPNGSHNLPIAVGGAKTDRELLLTVTDVRQGRAVSTTAPFDVPGGEWTVLECVAESDPTARVTVAVRAAMPAAASAPIPIAFSKVMLIPGDARAGDRLVALLARSLHHNPPGPATRPSTTLRPTEVPVAVLGEHLSSPDDGLRNDGGTWVATKWFLTGHTGDTDAEVYFNYDLASRRARFAEKDDDYDDDVLASLAVALRDGGRPTTLP